jgi:two-component system OmpR family response regulator
VRAPSIEDRDERARPSVEEPSDSVIRFAEWVLDVSSQQLRSAAGQAAHLTTAEYRVLVLLAQNPRRVISRDRLTDVAAGRGWRPFDRSIDVHISNLRRKLDLDPQMPSLIRTVRCAGYMFVPSRGA